MSKIGDLINKLCPNGVEYKSIGACCKIETGKLNANAAVENGEYMFFTTAKEPSKTNTYRWDEEALLIAGNANIGDVKHYKGKFNAYQRTYVLTNFSKDINVKYLYFSLSNNLKVYLDKHKNEAAMTYIVLSTLKNFKVAVPPLEVQDEIVRILDNFTLLSAELSVELSVEMKNREKQLEFYKSSLLKLYDKLDNCTLKDIAEYSKARISSNELNEDNYIGVDNLLQNKMGKKKSDYVPNNGNSTKFFPNDILIGNIRPYLKKIWFADCVGGTNGDILAIHIKNKNVFPKYLYFILSSNKFFDYDNSNSKGAKMPRGNKDAVMNYKFYLPSYNEQIKISNLLDNFDKINNDILEGLPAEIEARKKQYEYYRDKLLTFKELEIKEG